MKDTVYIESVHTLFEFKYRTIPFIVKVSTNLRLFETSDTRHHINRTTVLLIWCLVPLFLI